PATKRSRNRPMTWWSGPMKRWSIDSSFWRIHPWLWIHTLEVDDRLRSPGVIAPCAWKAWTRRHHSCSVSYTLAAGEDPVEPPRPRARRHKGEKGASRMLRRVTSVPLSEGDPSSRLFSLLRDPKRSDSLLRDLLAFLPDAAILVDSTGRLVLANELTERMFGYDSDELHGLR